jgi:succinate dehydrogenase / fumarate reductase, cytochrome b subunit
MSTPQISPHSPRKALQWFDARYRSAGMWAFALNRVTGLALTFYLFMHLAVLGTLARGPEAYDGFVALVKSPVFLFGEWLVVAAGFYHGLNGIRIVLTSFGWGVPYQKQMFYVLFVLTAVISLYFGYSMVTAH